MVRIISTRGLSLIKRGGSSAHLVKRYSFNSAGLTGPGPAAALTPLGRAGLMGALKDRRGGCFRGTALGRGTGAGLGMDTCAGWRGCAL